jgi:hypothetical protein
MSSSKIIIALAAFSSLISLASASHASELSTPINFKPLHGVSLDVGSERAVSYFSNDSGTCKLVVTLGDQPDWDSAGFAVTRFEAALRAGTATRYVSHEGAALEFSCDAGALAMSVKPLDQAARIATR